METYYPEFTYLVFYDADLPTAVAPENLINDVKFRTKINSVFKLEQQDKISKKIYDFSTNTYALPSQLHIFTVHVVKNAPLADFEMGLNNWGMNTQVLGKQTEIEPVFFWQATPQDAQGIVTSPWFGQYVRWVDVQPDNLELAFPEAKEAINFPAVQTSFGVLQSTPRRIGQLEASRPTEIQGMEGRVVPVLPDPDPINENTFTLNHATMIASVLIGNPRNVVYQGIAPVSSVYTAGLPDPSSEAFSFIVGNILQRFYRSFNVDAVVNSWYVGESNYNQLSVELDTVAQNLPIVMAAGNERGNPERCSGPNAQSICMQSSALAKNPITVGASQTTSTAPFVQSAWPLSSIGPVSEDNRVKPDLLAPGCEVAGAFTAPSLDNLLSDNCGSSFAAAQVTGLISLMKEFFSVQGRTGILPSTYKAILVQTADDIGLVGPDYETGFGVVDALAVMQFIENSPLPAAGVTADKIQQGSVSTVSPISLYTFDSTTAGLGISITMTYDDLPGNAATGVARVNDLDLVVISPSGEIFRPLVAQTGDSFTNAAQQRDTRNNVEKVIIPQTEVGLYEVRVNAAQVTFGQSQSFSLIADLPLTLRSCINPASTILEVRGFVALCQGTFVNPGNITLLTPYSADEPPHLSCLDTTLQYMDNPSTNIVIIVVAPNSSVIGCNIFGNYDEAIRIDDDADFTVVAGNEIIGGDIAIRTSFDWNPITNTFTDIPTNLSIVNNRMSSIMDTGIEMPQTTMSTIANNYMDGIFETGIQIGGEDNRIIDNVIRMTTGIFGEGIRLEDIPSNENPRESTNGEISGNRIENASIGIHPFDEPQFSDLLLSDLDVFNNAIIFSRESGVDTGGYVNLASEAVDFYGNFVCFTQTGPEFNIVNTGETDGTWVRPEDSTENICDPTSPLCSLPCPSPAPSQFDTFVEIITTPQPQGVGLPVEFRWYGGNIPPVVSNVRWSFGDGSIDIIGDNSPEHIYEALGVYTVTLTLLDLQGITLSSYTTTVQIANLLPQIAEFLPLTSPNIPPGSNVDFSVEVSAGDIITTAKLVVVDNSTGIEVQTYPVLVGEPQTISVNFPNEGSFSVYVSAEDPQDTVTSNSIPVNVQLPGLLSVAISVSGPASYASGASAATYTFTLTPVIVNGTSTPVAYQWNFPAEYGTGRTTSIEETLTLTYAFAGIYTVNLTVWDATGTPYTAQTEPPLFITDNEIGDVGTGFRVIALNPTDARAWGNCPLNTELRIVVDSGGNGQFTYDWFFDSSWDNGFSGDYPGDSILEVSTGTNSTYTLSINPGASRVGDVYNLQVRVNDGDATLAPITLSDVSFDLTCPANSAIVTFLPLTPTLISAGGSVNFAVEVLADASTASASLNVLRSGTTVQTYPVSVGTGSQTIPVTFTESGSYMVAVVTGGADGSISQSSQLYPVTVAP